MNPEDRDSILDQFFISNLFNPLNNKYLEYDMDFSRRIREKQGKTFESELQKTLDDIKSKVIEYLKKWSPDELVQRNINRKNITLRIIEEQYKKAMTQGNYSPEYAEKLIENAKIKKPHVYNAKTAVRDYLIELVTKIRVADYDKLVEYITKYVREPKLVIDNVVKALSAEYSGLTDQQKDNLREYLEIFNLTSTYDFEDEQSKQKAREELGSDPFVEARRKQLLKLAIRLDREGKYRLADKAEKLAR